MIVLVFNYLYYTLYIVFPLVYSCSPVVQYLWGKTVQTLTKAVCTVTIYKVAERQFALDPCGFGKLSP